MSIKHVSLNASTTNCTTSWNENLWRGVKTMKRKTLQTCGLKHSIKKLTCFLIWENLACLSWAGWVSSLPSLRKIAFSKTFEWYCVNVSSVKESDIWNDAKSKGFRNWIENTWLPIYKVFWMISKKLCLDVLQFLSYFNLKVGWSFLSFFVILKVIILVWKIFFFRFFSTFKVLTS